VRDGMRNAVFAWANTLNDTQRENWNTYAFNTPTFNRLGEATRKTGQQMYIRGYIPRAQALILLPTAAPTVFNLGDFTAPNAVICDASANTISVSFTDTDEWANTPDASLLVYQGRPQNATRIYGKGPYQLVGRIDGDSGTPPATPADLASLFPMAAGQRIFLKFNATMPDGRYSSPTLLSVLAVA
jgi:hypothetical protein